MRKAIKVYLQFCAIYYVMLFGVLGFLSVKKKIARDGYEMGRKESSQEIAGLKLALETLTKKRSPIEVGNLEIVPGTPSDPVAPKLVVNNA